MAKANITTKSGTRITVEGDAQEVAAIIRKVQGREFSITGRRGGKAKYAMKAKRQKVTPTNLVISLIDGGFFRKPKDLPSIRGALEEMGHNYPVTALSPVLLRLVRKEQLRRKKENNKWLYAG